MTRIFKLYTLNLSNITNPTVQFSSYPGALQSGDDFYQLSPSRLAVTETTLNVLDDSLYLYNTPQCIWTDFRVIIANRLAGTAFQWVQLYSQWNSGAYNNQWTALDYKLYSPGQKKLAPNTVWITEQMPGTFQYADVSEIINAQSYFPSYNVPYFPAIFNYSGYNLAVEQGGRDGPYLFSYDKYFRALLFAELQGKIYSLEDVQYVLQYNNYKQDPLQRGDPGKAQ
jgi:hypothetical protein